MPAGSNNKHVVQIHWQNSPSSPGDPTEQYQHAHDIEELVHEHCGEDALVRMCDPKSATDRLLKQGCTATVLVLAISDTKLDKDNAAVVKQLLKDRKAVFLVLKGLTDGNVTRFGISPNHANDVVVHDLDTFPKVAEPGQSVFEVLAMRVAARLKCVFNDYPVDNFALLLQQRRYAEVKQERRSWTLLLLALLAMLGLAVAFSVVASTMLDQMNAKVDILTAATVTANVHAQELSADLAYLETQYKTLAKLKAKRDFYRESLLDDQVALLLGIGELELTGWDFEAEQYFMRNRVADVNRTVDALCDLLGGTLALASASASQDPAQWARFVSYCENLHVLDTCNPTAQGDGTCDGRNNYHACNWDGGDCCPGNYCLDGTHVCAPSHWHHLDVVGHCEAPDGEQDGVDGEGDPECWEEFGFYSYTVLSDGVDRYTPVCTAGREATELVFVANIPPGGIVEIRVEAADQETPMFIEVYVVDDAFTTCPVPDGGLSAGQGPYFKRCVEGQYVLVEGDPDATRTQHAFLVVDIEDVTPIELRIKFRNTTANALADDGASLWARAQRCEIGHNHGLVGDGTCHTAYDTASCGWDGGDCRCVFGQPSTEKFGDGRCDVRFLDVWTNTRSCGWDGGDCAKDNKFAGGDEVSNFDKPRFDNAEVNDTYTVLPEDGGAPEVLRITRHDRAPGADDEVITLVALPRCQEPAEWICPHHWYNGKSYVTFSVFYAKEVQAIVHTTCPASPQLLADARAHFKDGRAICDCGCGAVDKDCQVSGVTVYDCENFANVDPLTLRFDPSAPEEPVPDTCLCV